MKELTGLDPIDLFVVVFPFAAMIYFIPATVAEHREHENVDAIFILNLLLGWSFAGWAVALVWAMTQQREYHEWLRVERLNKLRSGESVHDIKKGGQICSWSFSVLCMSWSLFALYRIFSVHQMYNWVGMFLGFFPGLIVLSPVIVIVGWGCVFVYALITKQSMKSVTTVIRG